MLIAAKNSLEIYLRNSDVSSRKRGKKSRRETFHHIPFGISWITSNVAILFFSKKLIKILINTVNQKLSLYLKLLTRKKKNERKKQQKPSFSVAPTQVLELIATACIWVTCTLMNQSKQDQGMEGFHWPSHCHMPLKELGSGISLSQTSQTKGGDPQGRIIFIEHLPCARHCAQLWRAP